MATTEVPPKPLKRLGFVQSAANYAHGYTVTADHLYRRIRSAVPSAVQPHLSKLEETVASYAVPAVNRAQDAGEKMLYFADDKVDYLVNTAGSVVNSTKSSLENSRSNAMKLHDTNQKVARDTYQRYWDQIFRMTNWAADNLNPIKGGQAAVESLKTGIEKAKAATDPDVAVQMASDAWNSFASLPIVSKLIETADPATRTGFNLFYSLHDSIVRMPVYKMMVDTSASTFNWASSTTPYKLGAQYIYPLVQPVADPAIDKLSHSKYVNEAIGYWKPTAAA